MNPFFRGGGVSQWRRQQRERQGKSHLVAPFLTWHRVAKTWTGRRTDRQPIRSSLRTLQPVLHLTARRKLPHQFKVQAFRLLVTMSKCRIYIFSLVEEKLPWMLFFTFTSNETEEEDKPRHTRFPNSTRLRSVCLAMKGPLQNTRILHCINNSAALTLLQEFPIIEGTRSETWIRSSTAGAMLESTDLTQEAFAQLAHKVGELLIMLHSPPQNQFQHDVQLALSSKSFLTSSVWKKSRRNVPIHNSRLI